MEPFRSVRGGGVRASLAAADQVGTSISLYARQDDGSGDGALLDGPREAVGRRVELDRRPRRRTQSLERGAPDGK